MPFGYFKRYDKHFAVENMDFYLLNVAINISIHSNTGTKKHNFQLAEARAASVAGCLAEQGIEYSRLNVMGSQTLNQDSKGEVERWRAVSVMFTANSNSPT